MLGTGKSLELMGLATFNLFVAMVLSVTFLSHGGHREPMRLTQKNISDFINQTTAVSAGQAKGIDQFGATEYLMKHIDDDSRFTGTMQYNLPGMDSAQRPFDLDKKSYISQVIAGLKARVSRHEATTRIEDIEIDKNEKEARVVTTSIERGMIPVDTGEEKPTMLAVKGISYCEQKIVLKDKTIRMAGATCSTNIATPDAE